MGKNYMPEIAQMLGVKIGEKFDILDEEGKKVTYGPYKITDNAVVDCDQESIPNLLYSLLTGEYTLQKRPWWPKDDSKYYTVSLNGRVAWCHFYKDEEASLALLNMGNCFPTKEAAKAAVPEMLAKFEEIKKGVRE